MRLLRVLKPVQIGKVACGQLERGLDEREERVQNLLVQLALEVVNLRKVVGNDLRELLRHLGLWA